MKIDIGLKAKGRETVATGLGRVLADTYALYLKTQNFHWNVTGPSFPYLHEMFGVQYQALPPAIDEVAERIRALGHEAPGGFGAFAKLTQIKDAKESVPAPKMVAELFADNEALVRVAREVKDIAEGVGDAETGDMMIERMQAHAKVAWMLRAQLE